MKLALCYTYFDGFEQLLHSLEKMSPHVDTVILSVQRVSNNGNINENFGKEVSFIYRNFPKVIVIFFNPELSINSKTNERLKHNSLIEAARKYGATHFILTACDHVYTPDHIKKGKDFVLKNNCDVTLTKMFTYYKRENWRLEPLESYYMPFIHKLNLNTQISAKPYNYLTDPSVNVEPRENLHVFDESEIILHHYSMLRTDIKKKFLNAAGSDRWKKEDFETYLNEWNSAKVGDSIKYFDNRVIVEI